MTAAGEGEAIPLAALAAEHMRPFGSRAALPERSAKLELSEFGVAVPRGGVATTEDEARQVASLLHPPLVVKVHSADLAHKSDLGGVRLGLADAGEAVEAFTSMRSDPSLDPYSAEILIEEMSPPGLELIVGAAPDPELGPLLVLGLGGIFVEVLQDFTTASCPLTPDDARRVIDRLKASAIIHGARGQRPLDSQALQGVLLAIGGEAGLVASYHRQGVAVEVDVNPLILTEQGAVAVDASVFLTPGGPQLPEELPGAGRVVPGQRGALEALFAPRSIAVIGASPSRETPGTRFIKSLAEAGYDGKVIPIHPDADQIEGLATARDLGALAEPVDYAYVAVPAAAALDVLTRGARNVRIAQVMSSGFGETAAGMELQDRLVAACKAGGTRLVGPNCMGTHSPRARMTFLPGITMEMGNIGVVSQSGGLGIDILRRGSMEGLRFSGLCTVGNSADVSVSDLVEYFLSDAQTEIIGVYVEDLKEGNHFVDLLRSNSSGKPLVVLRGGKTSSGRRVAHSHTGALIAGNSRAWDDVAEQFGLIMVDSLRELLQVLLAFQVSGCAPQRPVIRDVILFGNGGGTSVLGADAVERAGLVLREFPAHTRQELEDLNLPPGSSLSNPIDTPAGSITVRGGAVAEDILRAALGSGAGAAVICHINVAVLGTPDGEAGETVETIVQAVLRAKRSSPDHVFALVLRTDGNPKRAESVYRLRRAALEVGIAVYAEVDEACRAVAALKRHFDRIDQRPGGVQ